MRLFYGLGLFLLLATSCTSESMEGQVQFRAIIVDAPSQMDPHKGLDTLITRVFRNIFEPLFYSRFADGQIVLEPGLAESYTQDPHDKRLYTIQLREGLVWSDGVPLTTEDVLFSYERVLSPHTGAAFGSTLAQYIENGIEFYEGKVSFSQVAIKKVDSRTFSIRTTGSYPFILQILSHSAASILPKHIVQHHADQWVRRENQVASGPFFLDAYILKDSIRLRKNPLYWNKDAVNIDVATFYIVNDANTAYGMYLNGEVDWNAESIPLEVLPTIQEREDYFFNQLYAFYSIAINLSNHLSDEQQKALNSPLVRQALSLAIDKKQLTQNFLGSPGPATNYISGESFFPKGYQPRSLGDMNKEKAQSLLAQAGYPHGAGFPSLSLLYFTLEYNKRVAEYLQEQWRRNLNIEIGLENAEWKVYLERNRKGAFELTRFAWIADHLDPLAILQLFESVSPHNYMRYHNPAYDTLLQRARGEFDESQRLLLLAQAETMLLHDAPLIPLYIPRTGHLFNVKKWGGFTVHPQAHFLLKDYYPLE